MPQEDERNSNRYAVSPASINAPAQNEVDTTEASGGVSGLDRSMAMYSPPQTFLASFLGGPLAAAWLMSRNYRALGRVRPANRILWIGGVFTVLVLMIAFMLPERAPNSLVPILYSAAIYQYNTLVFGKVCREHFAAGGRKQSWWRVVGVGLLSLVILMGIMVAAAVIFPGLFG